MQQERDARVIFCAYIVKNGVRIYPRHAKAFCIRIGQ